MLILALVVTLVGTCSAMPFDNETMAANMSMATEDHMNMTMSAETKLNMTGDMALNTSAERTRTPDGQEAPTETPTEPAPAEAVVPTEPAPAEAVVPTEPPPAEAVVPTEPPPAAAVVPTEPDPTEAPIEPPTEAAPTEAAATEAPVEVAPSETAPTETVPAEAASTTATAPTEAPAPLQTTELENCGRHRSTDDETKFQKFALGRWHDFYCQYPLIWDQLECSCQARPVIIDDPNCPHHRQNKNSRKKFDVRAHGVWLPDARNCPPNQAWNQSNCRCDWDPEDKNAAASAGADSGGPCYPIFNATFDTRVADDSPFHFSIGRQPWQSVTIMPNVAGAHAGAARVISGGMPLWFTGANDLGTKLQIQFRFMVMQGAVAPNRDITLLSNPSCWGGGQTISISYRPNDQRYTVFFKDIDKEDIISCRHRSKDAYAFHHIDLVYFNELLTLTIDGTECFGTAVFQSGMKPTPCYMRLGGNNFNGYFDDVIFRRGCLEEDNNRRRK